MDEGANLSKMADVTKIKEQEAEKSLDEEVEKTPRTLEADSGIGWEGDSSTSGTVLSTENEKEVDSVNQDGRARRKNSDSEDEPPKKVVSIIYFKLCSNPCFKALD